jgi:hypothetical protein
VRPRTSTYELDDRDPYEASDRSGVEVVIGAGWRVVIGRGFDAETLRRVVAVLEGRMC